MYDELFEVIREYKVDGGDLEVAELAYHQLESLTKKEAHLAKVLLELWYVKMDTTLLFPIGFSSALRKAGLQFRSLQECVELSKNLDE